MNKPSTNRTPWTDIIRAQNGPPEWRAEVLNQLALQYTELIRGFIYKFSSHLQPADFDDRVQEFFHKFLRENLLAALDREKGNFRSFLYVTVRNFVFDLDEERSRNKRNHQDYADEMQYSSKLSTEDDMEEFFARAWAHKILKDAIETYRQECLEDNKPRKFEVIRQQLLEADSFNDPNYAETAESLGLTEKDVSNYLHRGKKRINAIVKKFIEETALDGKGAEEEREYLRRFFKS